MKKNNKGFFLAETIIVIALVTTVMAFVYPNVSKLNENYQNRVKYYDQTEDLYALKMIEKLLESETLNFIYPIPNTLLNSDLEVDLNNYKSMNMLNYFTLGAETKTDVNSKNAGCAKFRDETNPEFSENDFKIRANKGLFRIYEASGKKDSSEIPGIGFALDKIRRSYGINIPGGNNFDRFTCFSDYIGLDNNLNLDFNNGEGLMCHNTKKKFNEAFKSIKLRELYLTNYMQTPNSENYSFNKYLKRLKKTHTDNAAYRLIGVFEDNGIIRYASIKIDNPNPNRNCNLGGE